MPSKAERERKKKAASAKARAMLGSQNAGRPRQDGDRYPGGKLKPRKNERVAKAKRELVGEGMDIALAEDPLDFIHAKGWLSTARYKVALIYAETRRRAGLGGPRMDPAATAETSSTTGVTGRSLAAMTDSEIAEVFDHVFRDTPTMTAEEREAEALQKWMLLENAMTPDQSREVGMIVVRQSWSFWITALHAGHEPVGRYALNRQHFEAGLDAMNKALHKPKADAPWAGVQAYQSMPAPVAAKAEQAINFVDEAGAPVEMRGPTGKPFKVVQKIRA